MWKYKTCTTAQRSVLTEQESPAQEQWFLMLWKMEANNKLFPTFRERTGSE